MPELVTDPDILAQLNGGGGAPQEVADPDVLAQLNGTMAPDARPSGGAANAFARGAVEGVPIVGGMALTGINKGDAFIRAMQNGTSYADELAKAEDYGKRTDAGHPYAKMAGEFTGAAAATAPLAAAAPAAFGLAKGVPLIRNVASAMATNAGIGGVDAGVRSGGDIGAIDRGAALGGVAGTAGPVIGRLAGAATKHVLGDFASRGIPVPGMGEAAANDATKMIKASGGPERVQGELQRLGEHALPLDASPTLLGKAQGLAISPETEQRIIDPLLRRFETSDGRVRQSVENELGPVVEPTIAKGWVNDKITKAGSDLYDDVFANHRDPVDATPALAEIASQLRTATGPDERALLSIRDQLFRRNPLMPEGTKGINAMQPVTDLERLHKIKSGIYKTIKYGDTDLGVMPGVLSSEDSGAARVARALNGALEEQVPKYARANLAYKTGTRAVEALDNAGNAFGPGKLRPYDHLNAINAMPFEQQAMNRIGARINLDDTLGESGRDLQAMGNKLKQPSDHDYQRFANTFGPEPIDNIATALQREGTFRKNYSDIYRNSATAQRTASERTVRPRELSAEGGSLGISSAAGGIGGLAGDLAIRAGRLGLTATQRASDIARNRETARMLTMPAGPDRDAMMAALTARVAASRRGEVPGNQMDNFVTKLMQSRGYAPEMFDRRDDGAPQDQ